MTTLERSRSGTTPVVRAPGPRGPAAIAAAARLVHSPLALLSDLAAQGDVTRSRIFPGRELFVVSRPEYAEEVLVRHQDASERSFTYRPLGIVAGQGLLTSDGPAWRRHRKLLRPPFTRAGITAFTPGIVSGTRRTLDRLAAQPDGTVLDANGLVNRLALEIVGQVLFGTDLAGEVSTLADSVRRVTPLMVLGVTTPFLWTPRVVGALHAGSRRFGGPLARIDRIVGELVRQRREAGPTGATLLDHMLTATDADGRGLTDVEIRDEVTTFLLAGHETTAVTLGWCLALLSEHRDVRARLEDEAGAVLGDREPCTEDADRLPVTRAVVQEAMRLYPPAWTVERDLTAPLVVGGVRMPAGATVAVPPYLVHRHPASWARPEVFDPGRFLSGAERHRYAFMPFGAGRHSCIGAGLALHEAVLVLAMLGREYRFDLAGSFPVPHVAVTLQPGRRLPMRVTGRDRADDGREERG